jgi:hypothetical protein
MISAGARTFDIRRTVMLRSQGGPCYGAAYGCHHCRKQRTALEIASGHRKVATRSHFSSRLRTMEIVLSLSLFLLCVRIVQLHCKTPEFYVPHLKAKMATISQIPETPPSPRQPTPDEIISSARGLRPMRNLHESDYSFPGYRSPWENILKRPVSCGIAPPPRGLRTGCGPFLWDRPSLGYQAPQELNPK